MTETTFISEAELQEGLDALAALSQAEYHLPFDRLINESSLTDEERLLKIGRLMGITLKEPFAMAHEIDAQTSRTGAYRSWELNPETLEGIGKKGIWQFELMDRLRQEENIDSVRSFAEIAHHETGFFAHLAQSFRKYICGDKELQKRLAEAAEEVKKRTGTAVVLSPQALLGAGATSIATYLVQAIPWLSVAGAPIIAGFIVIIGTIGLDAFCAWTETGQGTSEVER